ncbi:MAG: arsinothricin resistance N-acetyltransferase ArsN1 [Thermomicrobiales bacterium]
MISVRPARLDDAAAIARIYNQGIRERIATFETAERTEQERRDWLAHHDPRYPVVVAVSDSAVVGWASCDAYRTRACYAGVAEFSIYVDAPVRGRGVGFILLRGLLLAAEEAGLWKLVSRIFVENAASRALCQKAGFREVGVYEKHAKLDDVWRDTVIVEKLIPSNLV